MSLVVKTVSDSEAARKDLSQLRASVDSVKQSVDSTSKSFASMAKATGAFLAGGLLLKTVMNLSDEFTNYENRLKSVIDNQADFGRALRKTKEIAIATRSDLDSVAKLYARISLNSKNIGIGQRSTLKVVETVSKTLKISGVNVQEAASSMQQFAQAIGSGRLQGDELRSILENNSVLAKAIADGLGIGVEKLREMGESGELVAKNVLQAILKQADSIDKKFGQLGVTYQSAFFNLGNSLKLLFDSVSKTFLGSSGKIASFINKIALSIGDFAINLEYNLARARLKLVLFVTDAVMVFGKLWEGLKIVFERIGERLNDLFEKLQPQLVAAGAAIVVFAKKIGTALSDAFVRFRDFVTGSSLFQRFAAAIGRAGDWIKTKFVNVWNNIKLRMPSVDLSGFFDKLNPIVTKVKEWARKVEGWFKWLYDKVVGNSWIPDLVQQVGMWLKRLLGAPLGYISSFVSSTNGLFARLAIATPFALAIKQIKLLKPLMRGLTVGAIGGAAGFGLYGAYKYLNQKTYSEQPIPRKQEATRLESVKKNMSELNNRFKQWFNRTNTVRNIKQALGMKDTYPGEIYGEQINTNAPVGRGSRNYREDRPPFHDIMAIFPKEMRAPIFAGVGTMLTLAIYKAMEAGTTRTVVVSLFTTGLLIAMSRALGSDAVKQFFTDVAYGFVNLFEKAFTGLLSGKIGFEDPVALLTLIAKTALLFESGRAMWMAVIKGIASAPTKAIQALSLAKIEKPYAERALKDAVAASSVADRVLKNQEAAIKRSTKDVNNVYKRAGSVLYDLSKPGIPKTLTPQEVQERARTNNSKDLYTRSGVPAAMILANVNRATDSLKLAQKGVEQAKDVQKISAEALNQAKSVNQSLQNRIDQGKERIIEGVKGYSAGIGGIIGGVSGFQIGAEIARGMEDAPAWKRIAVILATSFTGQFIGAGLGLMAGALVIAIGAGLTALMGAIGRVFAYKAGFYFAKYLLTAKLNFLGLAPIFTAGAAKFGAVLSGATGGLAAKLAVAFSSFLVSFPIVAQIGAGLILAAIVLGAILLGKKIKEALFGEDSTLGQRQKQYSGMSAEDLEKLKAQTPKDSPANWIKRLQIEQGLREASVRKADQIRQDEIDQRKRYNAELKRVQDANIDLTMKPLNRTNDASDDLFILSEPRKYASGGRVKGVGGRKEDNIPALLSNGEFVVNADATSKNLKLLTALNSSIPGADIQSKLGSLTSLGMSAMNPFAGTGTAKDLKLYTAAISSYLRDFINNRSLEGYNLWNELPNYLLPFSKQPGLTFPDMTLEALSKVTGGSANSVIDKIRAANKYSASDVSQKLDGLPSNKLKEILTNDNKFLEEAAFSASKIDSFPWRSAEGNAATVANFFKLDKSKLPKFAEGGLVGSIMDKAKIDPKKGLIGTWQGVAKLLPAGTGNDEKVKEALLHVITNMLLLKAGFPSNFEDMPDTFKASIVKPAVALRISEGPLDTFLSKHEADLIGTEPTPEAKRALPNIISYIRDITKNQVIDDAVAGLLNLVGGAGLRAGSKALGKGVGKVREGFKNIPEVDTLGNFGRAAGIELSANALSLASLTAKGGAFLSDMITGLFPLNIFQGASRGLRLRGDYTGIPESLSNALNEVENIAAGSSNVFGLKPLMALGLLKKPKLDPSLLPSAKYAEGGPVEKYPFAAAYLEKLNNQIDQTKEFINAIQSTTEQKQINKLFKEQQNEPLYNKFFKGLVSKTDGRASGVDGVKRRKNSIPPKHETIELTTGLLGRDFVDFSDYYAIQMHEIGHLIDFSSTYNENFEKFKASNKNSIFNIKSLEERFYDVYQHEPIGSWNVLSRELAASKNAIALMLPSRKEEGSKQLGAYFRTYLRAYSPLLNDDWTSESLKAESLDFADNGLFDFSETFESMFLNNNYSTINEDIKSILEVQRSKIRKKYASGGWIRGPGTGTSDSIPALLSNGEFIVNAASSRRHRSLLEKINGSPKRFAQGGVVRMAEGGTAAPIYDSLTRRSDIVKVNVVDAKSGVFGQFWEGLKDFDAEKIFAALNNMFAKGMEVIKKNVGWKDPDINGPEDDKKGKDTESTGEPVSPLQTRLLKSKPGEYNKIIADSLTRAGVKNVEPKDINDLSATFKDRLQSDLMNLEQAEKNARDGPKFMRIQNAAAAENFRKVLAETVKGMTYDPVTGKDKWAVDPGAGTKNDLTYGDRFKLVDKVFPQLQLLETEFTKFPDALQNKLFNYATSVDKKLTDLNERVIGPLGTPSKMIGSDIEAKIEAERVARLKDAEDTLVFFRTSFNQNKSILETFDINRDTFEILDSATRQFIINYKESLENIATTLDDPMASDDAKRKAINQRRAISANVAVKAERSLSNTGDDFESKAVSDRANKAGTGIDTDFYNRISDAQRQTLKNIIDGIEDAQLNLIGKAGKDRQEAQKAVDAGKAKLAKTVEEMNRNRLKEASDAFNQSIKESFENASKRAFKGEKDDDKTVWTTFRDSILDNFTKNVVDNFIKGMTDNLFDKEAIKGVLDKVGGGIFKFGQNLLPSIFKKKEESPIPAGTPEGAAGLPGSNAGLAGEESSGFNWSGLTSELGGGIAGLFSTLQTGFLNAIKGVDIGSWFSAIPDMLGKIDFSGMFDSVLNGIKMVASFIGFASGGYVKGPGTATSDSIPALLSNGEFVVNAASARRFGPLLSAINDNSINKLADGGFVEGPALSSTPIQAHNSNNKTQVFNIHITGDISRQTKAQIYEMLPQIAGGVNMHNREQGYKG